MYAIKAEMNGPLPRVATFANQKTMYGGKLIEAGDTVFLFASENEGGPGLVAVGTVTSTTAVPRKTGVLRQTPRVDIVVEMDRAARKSLGRTELESHSNWNDGEPETELNFKLYRQATNKIVGISPAAALFLEGFL